MEFLIVSSQIIGAMHETNKRKNDRIVNAFVRKGKGGK
jgi:hypothetical protein